MNGFSSIHIIGDDWRALCDQALAAVPDGHGDLAFLYLADELAGETDRIIDYLRQRSGIAHWCGCVGMGLCGTGRESYGQSGLSALFTPLGDDDFRIIPPLGDNAAPWLTATHGWRERHLASVAVVHADPTHQDLPRRLRELSAGLQGGFLVGGIASAERLPVQIADRAVGGDLSGVLLSGACHISTGLTQGCSLIGHKHEITACDQNIIERIDGRPALAVFKDDIGEALARDLKQVAGYIFAALPIRGSDTGDYLVRNLIGVDPEQGLVAIGDQVEPGMEIQFARRDSDTAHADLERMIDGLKARLPAPPKGALYHSCLGRGRHLFGDDSAELRLVNRLLGGDVPLAGFYANGEISHDRLYGYTGILTLFS